jgi:hypothetical protein
MAVTTSPGLFALPEGMFSHNAVTAITFSGNFSLAIVSSAPVTVAAPPMSPFINDIPAAGLIDIPPLQKQQYKTTNLDYVHTIRSLGNVWGRLYKTFVYFFNHYFVVKYAIFIGELSH